jgi:hypothetical protein
MKIRALIEEVNHLTETQVEQIKSALCAIDNQFTGAKSLSQVEGVTDHLKSLGWFIYKGGSHIAIHEGDGNPRRVAIIWESK